MSTPAVPCAPGLSRQSRRADRSGRGFRRASARWASDRAFQANWASTRGKATGSVSSCRNRRAPRAGNRTPWPRPTQPATNRAAPGPQRAQSHAVIGHYKRPYSTRECEKWCVSPSSNGHRFSLIWKNRVVGLARLTASYPHWPVRSSRARIPGQANRVSFHRVQASPRHSR